MKVHFNEINPSNVRRETRNGDEYLVFPLKPIKPMRLNQGYVPENHIQKSTPDWNGTPLTLNHPADAEGRPVSANDPDVADKTWLGHAFNFPAEAQSRPEGEGWIDIEEAKQIGGEAKQIVNDLEAGEPISVSSSYRGDELPPGEYDGEHRDKVKGNLRPDHIALLPNKKGVCSIEDGCMAGEPAANSELLFPVADDGSANTHPEDTEGQTSQMDDTLQVNKTIDSISFQETADGALDESDIPEDEPDGHYVFNGETVDDSSFPLVDSEGRLCRENVVFAFNHREHAPDEDKLLSVLRAANSEFEEPPLDDNAFDEPNSGFLGDVKSLLGLTTPSTNDTMNDKIKFLVNERGYDEENLPPEDSDCFEQLYSNEQRLVEVEDQANNTDDDTDDDSNDDSSDGVEQVMNELDSIREDMVTSDDIEDQVQDALSTNQALNEKRDLAETIVSNSDEHEDVDELAENNSKSVLETLAENVQDDDAQADHRGQFGASASASSNSEDASEWPSPVANERKAELDGGD